MIKLRKIYTRHQLVLNVIHGIREGVHELVKVLLVQEYLVLFICESFIVLVVTLLTLRDGEVVVVGPCGLDIEEIRALAGFYFLRVNLISAILVFFHKSKV